MFLATLFSTAGEDFTPGPSELNITANSSSVMVSISADDLVEMTELFTIRFAVPCEPLVQLGLTETNVSIVDATSKG